eukprot:SAG11_NODE_26353_length_346_cov_1.008097_1_plen_36_part_10
MDSGQRRLGGEAGPRVLVLKELFRFAPTTVPGFRGS